MARAVVTVLILLVVMAYLSLFLAWNGDPSPITTWELGSKYTQDMPVGLLFIAGVLVGSVAMALALWGPWKAITAAEEQQRVLVERAKKKLKSQDKEIKSLMQELEGGQGARVPEEAGESPSDEVPLSTEEAAAVAATETPEEAAQPEAGSEDDPEVV